MHTWATIARQIPPQFAQVRDVLVAQCPALEALWLDGDSFLFRWQKSSIDGTVREKRAIDRGECESWLRRVLLTGYCE